jgi:hypothetical protein
MTRLLSLGLVLAFSCLYMESREGVGEFVFQIEYDLLSKSGGLLGTLLNPLVFAVLGAQLLLFYCAVRATPNQKLNRVAILIISPIVVIVLLGGILSSNIRMILSTVPFAVIATALWRQKGGS